MTPQQIADEFNTTINVVIDWMVHGLQTSTVNGETSICLHDVIQWIKDGKA